MTSNLNILYIGRIADYFNLEDNESWFIIALENSIQAGKYLESGENVDAIICDYYLPGNNGIFLYEWIRAQSKYDDIPFVLLSKEFNADIYKKAFKKQINDYYVPSVSNPNEILNRIEFLCADRQTISEKESSNEKEEGYKMPVSKRMFDIFVSFLVLLFVSPVLLLILLAIRLESKGKVYYISKRVGRKTFDFYKLRSMRTGSDDLLKKLAKEKNQYKKEDTKTEDSTLDIPCPKYSTAVLLPQEYSILDHRCA